MSRHWVCLRVPNAGVTACGQASNGDTARTTTTRADVTCKPCHASDYYRQAGREPLPEPAAAPAAADPRQLSLFDLSGGGR